MGNTLNLHFISKKELKIFLTFLLIYSYFVQWAGFYENSIFSLTRAIVDEGRLEIDSYANQTSDRAYYSGHYYSDKAPGTSLLSIPVYAGWKLLYSLLPEDFKERNKGTGEYSLISIGKLSLPQYTDPGFFILTAMVLVTIFSSSLYSAMTVVLIYKMSKYFTNDEKNRILITIVFGLGSLNLPNATVLYAQNVGIFFAVLSFYILLKARFDKVVDSKLFILSGTSLGFAVTSYYSMIFVAIALFLYLLWTADRSCCSNKKRILYFLSGIFIGLLPFIICNYLVVGPRLELVAKYNDREIFWTVDKDVFDVYGVMINPPSVILRILFGSYRGLFFYYPVYILSLLGFFSMSKKGYKKESAVILLIFLLSLFFNYTRITWHGGYTFGPRFLLFSIPFLTIPILFKIQENKNRLFNLIFILLLSISVLNNLLSFQTWEDTILDRKTAMISENFQERIQKWQSLPNPLLNYYLPNFLEHGPRSRIFESISNGEFKIDIRAGIYNSGHDFPIGTGFFIPFLCLVPPIVFIYLLWRT